MSNSSLSIENSTEKSATSGEIQPKEEALSDDDTQQPSRKRVRMTENSGTSSGSTFGERMEDENHPSYKMILKLKADNKIFHGTLLQISNTSTDNKEKLKKVENENGKLNEKIATLEAEKKDLEEKMGENLQRIFRTTNNEIRQMEAKNVAFVEKSVQDCQKSVIHKLEKEHQEKLESAICNVKKEYEEKLKAADEAQRQIRKSAEIEFRGKLEIIKKEYEEKLKDAREQVQKSSKDEIRQQQESISDLKEVYEGKLETMKKEYEGKLKSVEKSNAQFEKRLSNMEKEFCDKMISSDQAIQKYEDCVAKMEAHEEVSIDYVAGDTIQGKHPIIFTDNCKFPATRAELEYQFKCIFCESKDHKSIDCRQFAKYDERKSKLRSQKRCDKCLDVVNGSFDNHKCPRSFVACSACCYNSLVMVYERRIHHPIVCRYNDQSLEREVRRFDHNQSSKRRGIPLRFT